jgi:hypothetical protein
VKVFEGRALNGVAGINEQEVRVLLARLPDDGGDARKAARFGFVGVVVEGKDVAVEVCRREDGDPSARARRLLRPRLLAYDAGADDDKRQQARAREFSCPNSGCPKSGDVDT